MLQFENIDRAAAKAYVKKPRMGVAKRPFSQLASQQGPGEGNPKAKKARSSDVAPEGLQSDSGRKKSSLLLTATERQYGQGRRGGGGGERKRLKQIIAGKKQTKYSTGAGTARLAAIKAAGLTRGLPKKLEGQAAVLIHASLAKGTWEKYSSGSPKK